jgi:hypothetical protein
MSRFCCSAYLAAAIRNGLVAKAAAIQARHGVK